MAITPVQTYTVAHNKNNGGSGGGTTYIMGGQKSSTYNSINVNSINASHGNIDYITAKSVSATEGEFLYFLSGDGRIARITGEDLKYSTGTFDSIKSDYIDTNKIKTTDLEAVNAWIETLNSKEITTEYLTVTKQAHFFELLIDKIRSVGGQLIITPASCVIDYVYAFDSNNTLIPVVTPQNINTVDHFNVYWRSTDSDNRNISNDFIENDQVICQSFSNVKEGYNYNVSNKYYWRLVKEVLQDAYINLSTGDFSLNDMSTDKNEYKLQMYNTYSIVEQEGTETKIENGIEWEAIAQSFEGTGIEIPTNVSWRDEGFAQDMCVNGTFASGSKIYGLNIKPVRPTGNTDPFPITSELKFNMKQTAVNGTYTTPSNINIGVYFEDNTYIIANNATFDNNYDFTMDLHNPEAPIEMIVVVSTNDVDWHLCHGISISNVRDVANDIIECDEMLSGFDSMPAAGDNLVQLGYRGNDDANRQSAIIISAYQSIDSAVKAPSYAAYMGIDDFDLPSHRGTYIDATGGYFKGKLVSSNGTLIDIDETLGENSIYYKIIPNYNIITLDGNVIVPSTLSINFMISGNTTLNTTVPENCIFNYKIDNGTTTALPAGSTVNIDISGMSQSSILTMNLLRNGKILDSLSMNVTDVPSGTSSGINGQYTQYAYKNATSNPGAPATSDSTYPPTGWSVNATTPDFANGEYTWCTYRTVSFTSDNVAQYGAWQTPYRITGDNGRAGEDGDTIEFIYRRFNYQPSWGSNDLNPEFWPTTDNGQPSPNNPQKPDYTGNAYPDAGSDSPNDKWTDNPRGIDNTYKFEYVASREFKLQNENDAHKTWGKFTTPSLWSRYGEKGQDGDGYEYIFKAFQDEIDWTTQTDYTNPQSWTNIGGFDTDEYYGPDGYEWSDDPVGVNDTDKKFEYVATRKKTDGHWGAFSEPSLWSHWVPAGSAGQNGSYYQYAYQNAINKPNKPSTSDATYPPSGWTETPSDPDYNNGEFTWCTYRLISYNASNTVQYGAWQNPYRITGNNGKPGEDGDTVEFIYRRFNADITTWPSSSASNKNLNPANWAANQDPDYFGEAQYDSRSDSPDNKWTDNPSGVNSTYKYEYVASREFKYQNEGDTEKSWGTFTEPALWSKYGDKGQDGDGYEYIFITNNDASSVPQLVYATTDRNGRSIAQDDYLPYASSDYSTYWFDDPQQVSESIKYQWVAIRKKKNGDWETTTDTGGGYGHFSTPVIWGAWATGTPGPQGPQGPAGPGAERYILVPIQEVFEVRIDAESVGAEAYENINGSLYTCLQYAIAHIDGNNVSYVDYNGLADYAIEIQTNLNSGTGVTTSWQCQTRVAATGAGHASINGTDVASIKFEKTNLLSEIYTNSDYHNYYTLHTGGNISKAPTRLNIQLNDGDNYIDYREIDLIFRPSHIWSVTDTALNSIYQGLSGTNGRFSTTGWSNIKQTWDQINLGVSNLKNYNNGDIQSNSNIEEYCYKRSSSKEIANPGTSNWGSAPSGWSYSTNYPSPTSEEKYTFQSHRSRTMSLQDDGTISYGTPTSWSRAELYEVYGETRGTVNSAQLSIQADKIKTEVAAIDNKQLLQKTVTLDLTSLSTTNFYPVSITLETETNDTQRITVQRELHSDYGVPAYGSHSDGFQVIADWSTVWGGWGTNWEMKNSHAGHNVVDEWTETECNGDLYGYGAGFDTYRYIHDFNILWTKESNSIPPNYILGSIRQNAMGGVSDTDSSVYGACEIIMLRGGSKYDVSCSYKQSKITLHSSGYHYQKEAGGNTWKRDMDVITSWENLIVPQKDAMQRSEIEQTANRISLSVFSSKGVGKTDLQRTGIDIESGKITLTGDNTDVRGNLNVAGSNSAFQFTDDNGNVKLSIANRQYANKDAFLNGGDCFASWQFGATYYDTTGSTDKVSIGKWRSGAITINGTLFYGSLISNNGTSSSTILTGPQYTITPKLYYLNGSSWTLASTGTARTVSWTAGEPSSGFGDATFSVSAEREYFIAWDWQVGGTTGITETSDFHRMTLQVKWVSNYDQRKVVLGNNGMGIIYSSNGSSYFYTGLGEADIRYPNYGRLTIDSTGTRIWKEVDTRTSATNYIERPGDYYITGTSGDYVPMNFDWKMEGEKCTIYNMRNTVLYVRIRSGITYKYWNGSSFDSYTDSSGLSSNKFGLRAHQKMEFVYDGTSVICTTYDILGYNTN